MSENPFLSRDEHPPFQAMGAGAVVPAMRQALEAAERELARVVGSLEPRTFESTLTALDELVERVSRAFGFARHLTQVSSSPELRRAYNEVLPSYSTFMASLSSHAGLWQALKAYAATDEANALEGVRRRHLEKTLQEFRRAGADLPDDQRERVRALRVELSQLSTRFSENVLDATNAYVLAIADERELEGLPAGARRRARLEAEARGLEGYAFTLQAPSYRSFMKFAACRARRRQLYRAFTDRAAGGDFDNRPVLHAILRKRRELAQLLGFRDFADLQLEDRMLESGAQAQAFERDLARRTLPHFRKETAELRAFARRELGIERLEPWDLDYAAESLRRSRYAFDEEELRPYFALDRVLDGVFAVAERLFGVRVERLSGVEVWHPDVRVYQVHDRDGTRVGSFYADWHPRPSKRDGAWMNPMVTGGPVAAGREVAGASGSEGACFRPHLGIIAANITPPSDDTPALLTHDEVTTLFHEFGHLLHHLLGKVEVPGRAGLGSVAWDFVELPSQIMENWAWEREGLDLFAAHVADGHAIPQALFERLRSSRTFLGASLQMRQLSLGTVDLALHVDYDPDLGGDAIAFGQHVMEPFVLRPEFSHNGFLTSFSHIFASGYAAGYYSYKWSEVLDADAFSRFQREGIFNPETGRAFVDTVLSRGDSEDPMALFTRFMGREPDLGALMRRNLGLDAERPAGGTPAEVG